MAEKLVAVVSAALKDERQLNYIFLRGFSVMPHLPSFDEANGLNAVAIATYPMYGGLAKLIGMRTPHVPGGVQDEINYLKANYDSHDFFFLHVKKVDSYGEDGNFTEKCKRIEEFDALLPPIL